MRIQLVSFLICLWCLVGCSRQPATNVDLASQSWEQISQAARGTTVRMAMWDGDPAINAYMREYVRDQLQAQYGLQVEFIGGQGSQLVNRMSVELNAGRQVGDIDVMWINGESFYQLRELGALFGPFTESLPNNRYINWQDPFVAMDFQQPIAGFECPWGNVQQAFIYDTRRVEQPPQNMEELAAWIRAHPGRFTFDSGFTGMTFLKCLLYALAGGPGSWDGPFDEEQYARESTKLWTYLRELRPYLWRKGETFPEGVAQLHQLLANGEVDFSMSNNDGEVDNKVAQGILPSTVRGYVWDSGTVRNSHYLGIPVNAPNKAGALLLINLLISPAAQLEKAKPAVWGDGSVLDAARLPEEYQQQFRQTPGRTRVAAREVLASRGLTEPAPEVMLRLHADFRRFVTEAH